VEPLALLRACVVSLEGDECTCVLVVPVRFVHSGTVRDSMQW
jgi:hypothetical protein